MLTLKIAAVDIMQALTNPPLSGSIVIWFWPDWCDIHRVELASTRRFTTKLFAVSRVKWI